MPGLLNLIPVFMGERIGSWNLHIIYAQVVGQVCLLGED